MIETVNGAIPLNENSYETLISMGYSDAEALQLVKSAMNDEQLKYIIQQRQRAYNLEADPLFIEWQFDQTPEAEQAWRAKVEEIKARYPKPAA